MHQCQLGGPTDGNFGDSTHIAHNRVDRRVIEHYHENISGTNSHRC